MCTTTEAESDSKVDALRTKVRQTEDENEELVRRNKTLEHQICVLEGRCSHAFLFNLPLVSYLLVTHALIVLLLVTVSATVTCSLLSVIF